MITLISMRHLSLLLLSGCLVTTTSGDPTGLETKFRCVGVITCSNHDGTTAGFDTCSLSAEDAAADAEAQLEKYATETDCRDRAIDTSCKWRGPCL